MNTDNYNLLNVIILPNKGKILIYRELNCGYVLAVLLDAQGEPVSVSFR